MAKMVTAGKVVYRIPRFQTYFRLWLQTQEPPFRPLNVRCYELGEDGMGLELSEALLIEQVVLVVFTLPRSNCSWNIAAKVVNRSENQYDLLFLYRSPSERKFIHAFLEYLHDVTPH